VSALQAVAIVAVAGLVSWIAVAALVPVLRRRGMLDVPNSRSSHEVPVPRGGGLGLLVGLGAGLVISAVYGAPVPGWPILLGLLLMAGLGSLEDFDGGLPVFARLISQIAAATVVVWQAGPLQRLPLPAPLDVELGAFGWPLSLVWIVAVLNIFNFLDGIDGFAAVQGVVAGLGLAAVGWGSWLGPLGLAIAGACFGFLFHNWHPARIFMGDVGSLSLGFLLAVSPFGEGQGRSPMLVFAAGLCLWFFLSDGVYTIGRRLIRGERIWQAHRSHLYQRLAIAGWSHARIVRWVAPAMVIVAAAAVGSVWCGRWVAMWTAACIAGTLFVVYWAGVVAVERRTARENGHD
jgi:UDP-N-acetylmuramyl pentapeptide phosphotransferase/UDP-N-acetylglucosamine-1-phosphate transferase